MRLPILPKLHRFVVLTPTRLLLYVRHEENFAPPEVQLLQAGLSNKVHRLDASKVHRLDASTDPSRPHPTNSYDIRNAFLQVFRIESVLADEISTVMGYVE